jgi:PKD repeat protein/pimeloyl-ACP methyl ester carboxylesterase
MKKIYIILSLTLCLPFNKLHALADLVISTITPPVASVNKGAKLVMEATVKNQGNTVAAANYMFLYLSTDNIFQTSEVIGRVSIKQLAPNETQLVTFTYSVSSTLAAGNYQMGFEVDPYNDILETDESNFFRLASSQTVAITNTLLASRRIPYPIIFIHGLNSNSKTWDAFTNKADSAYGWVFGGRLSYCLNPDGSQSTSDADSINRITQAYTNGLGIGDYYYINFDVSKTGQLYVSDDGIPFNDDYSNQSAITKQGWAVKDAIRRILMVTGAEKVVLVGHSMGGLASREYFQNPSNWQTDGKHHVAKLFTAGTPHGGSNADFSVIANLFGIVDSYSEAVRDLRHPTALHTGWYLFGGSELTWALYYNRDVNCNGRTTDMIIGLNEKTAPSNINYACIASNYLQLGSDQVVYTERADMATYLLPQPPLSTLYADKFYTTSAHTSIHTANFSTMIQGLDEPFSYNTPYTIDSNSMNYGHITIQASNNPNMTDHDVYKVTVAQRGLLEIKIGNIPVQDFTVTLRNSTQQILQQVVSNANSNLAFSKVVLAGDYYIEFVAAPTTLSYQFPYLLETRFTPATPLVANFSSNVQTACAGSSINFLNQSVGTPTQFIWNFTGGTPNTATTANPVITYNTVGTYPVSLTIKNLIDTHNVVRNGFITINSVPTTDYSFNILPRDTVVFTNLTNTSGLPTTYSWTFGDGGTSTQTAPVHKYLTRGNFTATLTAQNVCGNTNKPRTIAILPNALNEIGEKSLIHAYPNPNQGQFELQIENQAIGEIKLNIYNIFGQLVWQNHWQKTTDKIAQTIDFKSITTGTYLLKIECNQKIEYFKFMVE